MNLKNSLNGLVVIIATISTLISALPANAQNIPQNVKAQNSEFGDKIDSKKLYREQLQNTLNGNVKKHVKDELIVKLNDKNQLNLFKQQLAQGIDIKEIHENGTYVLKYSLNNNTKKISDQLNVDLKNEYQKLSINSLVEFVELNVVETKSSFTPSINNFAKLWHHKNSGQPSPLSNTYQYYMTSGIDIKTDLAWDITQGSASTVVAVIDGSFDTALPEFNGKITNAYNFVDNNFNVDGPLGAKTGDDVNNGIWHGSSVAAIVAGKSNEVYGVCPECKIMPLKVLGESYNPITGKYIEDFASVASITSALNYATIKNANVINMSFGANFSFSPSTQAAVTNAYQKNITLVAAAGNENNSAENYPSDYNHVISVAALTADGYKADYSNFGSKVAVSAPVSIVGRQYNTSSYRLVEGITSPSYMYNGQPKYTKNLHGTSFSSPMVSGAAGLMISKNPNLTPTQVASILKSSANTSIYSNIGNQNYAGKLGAGMLNVFEAVKAVDNNPITKIGSLEEVNCSDIRGWAYIPNQNQVNVEIALDDIVIATTQTNIPRPDIQNIIQVNGNYGFKIKTPAVAKNGLKHVIKAFVVSAGIRTQLPDSISLNCNIQDFNKDNKSDILWRNKNSGDNLAWNFKTKTATNDTLNINYQWLPKVNDSNWEIIASADFNMDGDLDVMWRHKPSGGILLWFLNNNSQIIGTHWLTWVQDQNWQIAGVGDFDADGQVDILWRNKSTGHNLLWIMKGLTINYQFLEWVDNTWEIKSVADFDADGNTDVLWINKNSQDVLFWQMNKATRSNYVLLDKSLFNYFGSKIEKIADFDGDNKVDILFRAYNGNMVIQYLVGPNNDLNAGMQSVQPVLFDWEVQ
jgi:Subtilase family